MSPREPQLLDTLAPGDGAERARVRFEPEGAEVRVPSGRKRSRTRSAPSAGSRGSSTRSTGAGRLIPLPPPPWPGARRSS